LLITKERYVIKQSQVEVFVFGRETMRCLESDVQRKRLA